MSDSLERWGRLLILSPGDFFVVERAGPEALGCPRVISDMVSIRILVTTFRFETKDGD